MDRILKEIQKKTGKKGAVTSLVETGEDGQLKLGKRGQAIAGMISGEQKKAAQALELLTGEKIDPASINLDELNLKQIAEVQSKMEKGDYDEELFGKYLLQAFQGVFEKELSGIDRELGKYQPKEESRRDKQMLTVEGFITKNHTSAHARGVGGVCVSGDNPEGNEPNQWDMPNYLQMVLRDEKTKVCQGLVLMHIYEQDNEKVLTASFNPSSTYLFKVDEQQLFAGLLHQLKDFASANGIDKIAVSKNTQIRTNRTGGEFERAIVDAIQSKNKGFDFKEGQVFSYKPAYQQKELDLL
ncbi:TPA: hypothetical protein DCQ44_01925 [Candidatus Taylorbacteria bacterium]|nr:hypothetical protein [Candidatus Taylorbacteria bacterium]